MPVVARSGLRVVSRERREPLTDAETVQLGRRLGNLLGVEHVSYPDDGTFVEVLIWGFHETLPQQAVAAIAAVIGAFDVVAVQN